MFDEARAIIASHDPEDLEQWLVWRDDWLEWQPASQVPGLDEKIHRELPVPAPELPSPEVPKGFVTDELSISISRAAIRPEFLALAPDPETTGDNFIVRAKKRHKKRYSVSIEIDGKKFKTFTRDISVGGVNVEDVLPDWIKGYFKIRIGKPNSKQQIELQCCLVEGQLPNARYRVMILPLQNQNDEINLDTWLAA